jgi:hypothetical protein
MMQCSNGCSFSGLMNSDRGFAAGVPRLHGGGPGSSLLVQASSVFVKEVKVSLPQVNVGLVLYGLAGAPPMDVPAEWSEARRVVVPANLHKVILPYHSDEIS